ncbi:MAG TPA: NAD(P)-binding domain-containing protein [Burkholderiales bacterium]|nr:NAD(P)-binding domain-containing protein [Burkholderiales bacterium]
MSKSPVVGVAGCGSMGLPMAQALQHAGYEVWGLDIRRASEFGSFQSRMVEDPAEFASRVQVVISVVRDVTQNRELCFDRQALFTRAQYPGTLIVSSTLSPRFLPELRNRLPVDVTLVDAPMSGAPHAARLRKLSFMLGGPGDALDRLMPLFQAMGEHVFRLGPLGAGMTAKVLNNYVASASVVSVRRAYARARELGADLEALRSVMKASSGSTWFGDHFHDIDWSHEGYEADNTIGILEKDIRSGLDAMCGAQRAEPDAFDAALLAAIRAMEPFEGP